MNSLFEYIAHAATQLSWIEIMSTFIVLFPIIDVTGSVPIFLSLRERKKIIEPAKAALYSFGILLLFLFLGEVVLRLFSVDLSSFAVAGALVILIIAAEMIFGVQIFRFDGNESGSNNATLVPVVFPLIAGPGTFTALLAMRAEFSVANVFMGLLLNMVLVFLAIRYLDIVKKIIGVAGIYILQRFFGVVLLAIAVRLITSNLDALIELVRSAAE
jgi:multiple antibiotic resistance protein